jgi:serine/threonine protein kinase
MVKFVSIMLVLALIARANSEIPCRYVDISKEGAIEGTLLAQLREPKVSLGKGKYGQVWQIVKEGKPLALKHQKIKLGAEENTLDNDLQKVEEAIGWKSIPNTNQAQSTGKNDPRFPFIRSLEIPKIHLQQYLMIVESELMANLRRADPSSVGKVDLDHHCEFYFSLENGIKFLHISYLMEIMGNNLDYSCYKPDGKDCLYQNSFIESDSFDQLTVFYKMARQVQILNENGIVHRDVNPLNFLIDGKGSPVLSDFGLASFVNLKALPRGTALFFDEISAKKKDEKYYDTLEAGIDIYALAVSYFLLVMIPIKEIREQVSISIHDFLENKENSKENDHSNISKQMKELMMNEKLSGIENQFFYEKEFEYAYKKLPLFEQNVLSCDQLIFEISRENFKNITDANDPKNPKDLNKVTFMDFIRSIVNTPRAELSAKMNEKVIHPLRCFIGSLCVRRRSFASENQNIFPIASWKLLPSKNILV